jgi:hypothetical protein
MGIFLSVLGADPLELTTEDWSALCSLQTIFHLCIPKKDLSKPHLIFSKQNSYVLTGIIIFWREGHVQYTVPPAIQLQHREQHTVFPKPNYDISQVQENYISRLELQRWPLELLFPFLRLCRGSCFFGYTAENSHHLKARIISKDSLFQEEKTSKKTGQMSSNFGEILFSGHEPIYFTENKEKTLRVSYDRDTHTIEYMN